MCASTHVQYCRLPLVCHEVQCGRRTVGMFSDLSVLTEHKHPTFNIRKSWSCGGSLTVKRCDALFMVNPTLPSVCVGCSTTGPDNASVSCVYSSTFHSATVCLCFSLYIYACVIMLCHHSLFFPLPIPPHPPHTHQTQQNLMRMNSIDDIQMIVL